MKRSLLFFLIFLTVTTLRAEPAPDAEVLTKLLHEFLAGATRNDDATHERFWADDLIYTSSAGNRTDKVSLLREVREEGPTQPDAITATFTAEDIRIQQYGDTAVVAFRLVLTKKDPAEIVHYLNTGTFVKKNGQWQAVAWQATMMPKRAETKQ